MTQESNNYVLQRMAVYLDNNQMMKLKNVLDELVHASDDVELVKDSYELLAEFLATKRLEGRSERTLMFYRVSAEKLIAAVGKNVCSITTEDIREYLSNYQIERGVCKASIDNTRRNLSSFFKWLEDENYIFKSPLRRIHKIKMTHSVKDTYADEELEKLRDDCSELRNLAIIDILNSTGMRVGELVNLDRDDVDFNERECLVLGKGDKERVVYFDARSKLHLKKYLKSRTDNNPALFVSLCRPYNRLLTSGVEIMLKKMGKKCNIAHVHPHKFRRTMATTAIDKGMPIEQVQRLLGHEKIDTTLHYAMVKQNNVKISHKKYIG